MNVEQLNTKQDTVRQLVDEKRAEKQNKIVLLSKHI